MLYFQLELKETSEFESASKGDDNSPLRTLASHWKLATTIAFLLSSGHCVFNYGVITFAKDFLHAQLHRSISVSGQIGLLMTAATTVGDVLAALLSDGVGFVHATIAF